MTASMMLVLALCGTWFIHGKADVKEDLKSTLNFGAQVFLTYTGLLVAQVFLYFEVVCKWLVF